MKIILTILLAVFLYTNSSAQAVVTELKRIGAKKRASLDTNGWKRSGVFLLNINQSAQMNWASGGEKFMLGISGILNESFHHRSGKFTFDNYFDLELGVVEATSFDQLRKTSDRCDITTEIEHSIKNKSHWTYGFLGNFNSQLFNGYTYSTDGEHTKISSFLSPGKILLSLGLDYKHINAGHYFSMFITPATVRLITKIEEDFYSQKKFGVDSFQKTYTEIGAYLTFHYNGNISKTTSVVSRLDLFSNYKRNPGNVDVLFNNILTVNISKKFVASFIVDILYDHDVTGRLQLQEMMGIAYRVKF
jgi:Protein of unknown function (DUF3078)